MALTYLYPPAPVPENICSLELANVRRLSSAGDMGLELMLLNTSLTNLMHGLPSTDTQCDLLEFALFVVLPMEVRVSHELVNGYD